jgi:hypothetical protein
MITSLNIITFIDVEKMKEVAEREMIARYAIVVVLSTRLNHDVLCAQDDFRSAYFLSSSFA